MVYKCVCKTEKIKGRMFHNLIQTKILSKYRFSRNEVVVEKAKLVICLVDRFALLYRVTGI
jgi:hypothetical protein